MPRDSSDIDAAVITILQMDPTLKSLLPDGVHIDVAPGSSPAKTRFGIVTIVIAEDVPQFGGRAIESVLYLVKAVMLSTANGNINAAAERIDELLEDQPVTAPGYSYMTMHREERVRYTEVDSVDTSIRWFHRGGRYRVQMATA